MSLQIDSSSPANGIHLLRLSGRLTAGLEASALESAIDRTKAAGVNRVILDMKEVNYVDSSGLGALIASLSKLKKASGGLRLISVDDRVVKLLKLTHIDGLIPIDPSLEAACRNLGE